MDIISNCCDFAWLGWFKIMFWLLKKMLRNFLNSLHFAENMEVNVSGEDVSLPRKRIQKLFNFVKNGWNMSSFLLLICFRKFWMKLVIFVIWWKVTPCLFTNFRIEPMYLSASYKSSTKCLKLKGSRLKEKSIGKLKFLS